MKRQILLEPSPTTGESRKPLSDRHLRVVAVALALLLAIPSGGCSWIGVTKPPSRPIDATPPVQCTSGVAAPVGDTILSVLTLVSGIGMTAFGSLWSSNNVYVWGGIGLLAVGVTTGVSAGFGYNWTADCRELEELQNKCIAGVEASCKNLQVGPPDKPNRGANCSKPEDCKGGTECKKSDEGQGICVEKVPTK
ncbi:MAG: hypothetical protein NTY18_07190 [Deltaproteobacteria bacterium]|nr:hypothetical protein [Deltaproteobacteria bacterium]